MYFVTLPVATSGHAVRRWKHGSYCNNTTVCREKNLRIIILTRGIARVGGVKVPSIRGPQVSTNRGRYTCSPARSLPSVTLLRHFAMKLTFVRAAKGGYSRFGVQRCCFSKHDHCILLFDCGFVIIGYMIRAAIM